MSLRALLNLILRPIPAGETPEAVRARRTGDYAIAGFFAVFVLAGVFWLLHRQITQAPGDFSDRNPRPAEETEAPRRSVEVELTFTPENEPFAMPAPVETPEPAKPLVVDSPRLRDDLPARVQGDMKAYGETVRGKLETDLRAQADALVRNLPPPPAPEAPPPPTAIPPPASVPQP